MASDDENNSLFESFDIEVPEWMESIQAPIKLAAYDKLTDKYMAFVQTTAAVLGLVGAARVVGGRAFPSLRPIRPIWGRLKAEVGRLPPRFRRISYDVNPYKISKRAVILQGPARVGTTTLLFTKIPFFRSLSMNPFGWDTMYLDGYSAAGVQSFSEWITFELWGSAGKAGQEMQQSIKLYRHKQRWRVFFESIGFPIRPIPLFIIVDHFETVIRHFPGQAGQWAKVLAHEQFRKNDIRVIFVVKSIEAVQTLQHTSGEKRFKHLIVKPPKAEDVSDRIFMEATVETFSAEICLNRENYTEEERERRVEVLKEICLTTSFLTADHAPSFAIASVCTRHNIDKNRELYRRSNHNIGIYNLVRLALAFEEIEEDEVEKYVMQIVGHIRRHEELPLSFQRHLSWVHVDIDVIRHELKVGLHKFLSRSDLSPEENRINIKRIMDVVNPAIQLLVIVDLTETSMTLWQRYFENLHDSKRGLTPYEGHMVGKFITLILHLPCQAQSGNLTPDPLDVSEKLICKVPDGD